MTLAAHALAIGRLNELSRRIVVALAVKGPLKKVIKIVHPGGASAQMTTLDMAELNCCPVCPTLLSRKQGTQGVRWSGDPAPASPPLQAQRAQAVTPDRPGRTEQRASWAQNL